MGTSRRKTAFIAALTMTIPTIASSQGGAGTTGTATTSTTASGVSAITGTNVVAAPAGGLQIDVGVKTGISIDDNFKLSPGGGTGTSTISDTNLSFGIGSITSNQTIRLDTSGVLRFAHIPGRSVNGFEDPNLRFKYIRDAANSRLTIDANYRHADREFLDPFQVEREQQQSTGLTTNGGTVTWRAARLVYEMGLNDPIGFKFDLSHNQRDYANVPNPLTYFDNKTDKAAITGTFALSQVSNVSATAAYTKYDALDVFRTSRRTTDFSVGLTQDINPVLRMNVSAGYTRIKTDQLGIITTKDGATGSLDFVRQLSNGSASVNIAESVNQNGNRSTLTFGRTIQLPTGSIGASIGLTRGPSGGFDSVGTLSYDRTLKYSNYTVSLSRVATTNTASAEIIDTRLAVNYGYQIDTTSRIDVTLDWGRQEDGGGGTIPTVQRTNLRAAYTRALTSDWNLQGGVLLRHLSDSSVANDAQSNALFVTLDRSFSFRP